jgi:hypothetical protein
MVIGERVFLSYKKLGSEMSNFWLNKQGQNTLKGSLTNPLNPIILPDDIILEFLKTYPSARTDLFALLPTLELDEQARLQDLIDAHPTILRTDVYPQVEEDRFQSKLNSTRVNTYTVGLMKGSPPVSRSPRVNFVKLY